jgi:hypothetical protein
VRQVSHAAFARELGFVELLFRSPQHLQRFVVPPLEVHHTSDVEEHRGLPEGIADRRPQRHHELGGPGGQSV